MWAQLRAPEASSTTSRLLKSAVDLHAALLHLSTTARRTPIEPDGSVTAMLFVAFVASVRGGPRGHSTTGSATTRRRIVPPGPFGQDYENANRAGVFYTMFLPMFLSLMLFRRSTKSLATGRPRWHASVVAFAIFVTYSRQAYLIAAVAVLLLGLEAQRADRRAVVALRRQLDLVGARVRGSACRDDVRRGAVRRGEASRSAQRAA